MGATYFVNSNHSVTPFYENAPFPAVVAVTLVSQLILVGKTAQSRRRNKAPASGRIVPTVALTVTDKE